METPVILNSEIDMNLSAKDIAKKLAASDGCKSVKGLIKKIEVQGVTTSEDGYDYYPVVITLREGVPAYLPDNDGKYVLTTGTIIYTTLDVIASILRENEDAAYVTNNLVKNPDTIEMVLTHASVDIIQQDVPANREFINPFSSNRKPRSYDHNVISNFITNFTISAKGLKLIEKLEDKMLDSCTF